MSVHATRAILIRKYLRARGEGQISRLLSRLPPHSLAALFRQLNDRDLRRIAAGLFAPDAVAQTASTYSDDALILLLESAEHSDAGRLLHTVGEARAQALTCELTEVTAHALMKLISPKMPEASNTEVSAVLRMPRIFA